MRYDALNKIPLYYRLVEIIEDKIESGEWKKGERIPSERELCDIYKMSRITVRNALEELVRQGRLNKIQGKGTYVMGKSIIQNLGNVYSFSKEMEKQGKISGTKLIKRHIENAKNRIARKLGIEVGQKIVFIERVRYAEETPIMVEKTYFPADKFEFLMDIDLDQVSLYKTLEEDYGVYIDQAVETFSACELQALECQLLNCNYPQYGLNVRRTSFSGNKIVCYSSLVSKGDSFSFTVRLKN